MKKNSEKRKISPCESKASIKSSAAYSLKLGAYILEKTIGRGSFGKVKSATNEETGVKVAIKIISRAKMKELDIVVKVKREIKVLKYLHHPDICKLYEVLSDPNYLFLVMEYIDGGELFDYIVSTGRLTTEESRKFFQQIISAIDYCHGKGVVHRDIKPENILLDKEKNLKLIDFGLSNGLYDGSFLTTSCGSPNYAAPELVSGKLYSGPEVDIWSCGVLLYVFLTGRLPFDDDDLRRLFRKIKTGVFFVPSFMDPSVADLIRHMLNVDCVHRASVKDIIDHTWFKVDLPAYLFPPLDDCQFDPMLINPMIVGQLCQAYHLSESRVRAVLTNDTDPRDSIKISYKAMLNKLENENMADSKDSNYGSSESSTDEIIKTNFTLGQDIIVPKFEKMSLKPSKNPSKHKPTRCNDVDSVCIKPGEKFCKPDCDLCPKLGASECLFGTKLPSLTTCDNCSKYGKSGCVFSADPSGNIEELDHMVTRHHPEQMKKTTAISSNLEYNSPSTVKIDANHVKISQKRLMTRKKWTLGIRSQSQPHNVMKELFRSLKSVDMEWNIINPYRLIARKRNVPAEKSITICLQLYKSDAKSFLLDFTHFSANSEEESADTEEPEKSITPTLDDNQNMDEFISETCQTQTQENTDYVSFDILRQPEKERTNFASKTMIFLDLISSIIRALAKG